MRFSPLFFLTVVLILASAININASFQHRQSHPVLSYAVGGMGFLGALLIFVRLIIISIVFKWWWFFAFAGVGLLVIGVFSFLTRTKTSLFFGTINILLIPFIWWYGSKFNRVLSYDWMYDTVDAIKEVFS